MMACRSRGVAAWSTSCTGRMPTVRSRVFEALSNRGLGAEELERALRERVESGGARVIFTDLPAGSVTVAARRVMRDRADLVLVTGANVATLLDFVFHDESPAVEAARHAAEKGRGSLVVFEAAGGR